MGSFFEMATMTSQVAGLVDEVVDGILLRLVHWLCAIDGDFRGAYLAGRTIRQLVVAVALLAHVATSLWFTLLGGSGIFYQMSGAIDLGEALNDFQFDVATLAVAQALPGGN